MNITTGINQSPEIPFPTLREHALSALVRSGQPIPDDQKASLMVVWNEIKNHFENDKGDRSPLTYISSCEVKILYPDPASFDWFGILIDKSQIKPEAERQKEFMEKIGNLFLELSECYPSKDFFGNVIPFNTNAYYLAIKRAPYPKGRILKESDRMSGGTCSDFKESRYTSWNMQMHLVKGMAKELPGPREAEMLGLGGNANNAAPFDAQQLAIIPYEDTQTTSLQATIKRCTKLYALELRARQPARSGTCTIF
jgi:hypothetical protein